MLSALPLPRSLDPKTPATLPSRLYTLLILVRDTASALVRLPFFVFPLAVHAPVYAMGRLGARLVEDEEETQAQNKVAFGFVSLLLIYPAAFCFLWALFMYTRTGALLAFVTLYLFAKYHNKMIDGAFDLFPICVILCLLSRCCNMYSQLRRVCLLMCASFAFSLTSFLSVQSAS